MKKKITSIIILIILLYITFEVLTTSSSILNSILFSISIWKNNIFPSLFPFFVLSEMLINYGFVELISELFKPFMQSFFKINSKASFVLGMGILSGFPSSAKYTKELYISGDLNENEAAKVLTFTHFSNPLFILGTISGLFLNNKEIGYLILLCHYFGNFIVGFLFRNYYPSTTEKTKFSIKLAINKMHNKRINNNLTFGEIITNSLLSTINTLLLILGVITMFLVITTIIDNNISLNNYYQTLLNGFFEMTQGLKYVSLLNIPLKLKTALSTMFISFGGLSVHIQTISILSNTKIKYMPYLTARIMHALISSLLIFILFDFWIMFI